MTDYRVRISLREQFRTTAGGALSILLLVHVHRASRGLLRLDLAQFGAVFVGDAGEPSSATKVIYERTDGSSCWKFMPKPGKKYIFGVMIRGIHISGEGKVVV